MSPIRRVTRRQPSIYTPAFRRDRRLRFIGWLLGVAGAVMALAHMVTHLGRWKIIGYQDLLLGYPMASMLVLAGVALVGWAARPTR